MKISIEEIIRLHHGLSLLDGYDRATKDGANERIVREYYKLGAGLRLSVAMDIDKLLTFISAYQKQRNALVFQLAGAGKNAVPDNKLGEFSDADRALLDTEHEIALTKIKPEELRLDENPIPATALSMIQALLRD